MKRTSSAKLGEMPSIQKCAFDRIGLASTIVFVPPSNNVEIENTNVKTDLASENIDKHKSILGATP